MEGGAEGEHLGPASLAAGGKGMLRQEGPSQLQRREGQDAHLEEFCGRLGGYCAPYPLRSLIHLLKERLGGHKWGQVSKYPALFRINKPDPMWPA